MLKNKFWYYLISFTWGALMSIPGFFGFLLMQVLGHEPMPYSNGYYFLLPGNFGGISLGPYAFVSEKNLLPHEYGHSIQNCIFGPFFLMFVGIPSFVRYWYRTIKKITQPDYYYIWFEAQASMFGERYGV